MLHRLLRNCSATPDTKGSESPSARVSGRHRVAPVARLGLRECQNIPARFSGRKRIISAPIEGFVDSAPTKIQESRRDGAKMPLFLIHSIRKLADPLNPGIDSAVSSPELQKSLQPHHLKADRWPQDRRASMPPTRRAARLPPNSIAEGQWSRGEDHRQHNQRQFHDPHHQVDLRELASECLAQT